ncbi:MAG: hypothetical protein AAF242_20010 [Bacteroidota bacterium]
MWEIHQIELTEQVYQYQIRRAETWLSFSEVIQLWQVDLSFRIWYTDQLNNCPFEAFFWEHPPITITDLEKDYEFVLIKSTGLLGLKANPRPFQSFFKNKSLVVDFPNLRGDAHLVVPGPIEGHADYTHLACFLRSATEDQIDQFWQTVGDIFRANINIEPTWLSTHGLGVAWLHVRIDRYPKYYHHASYSVL